MSASRTVLRATLGLALVGFCACGGSPPDAGISPVTTTDPNMSLGSLGSQLVDVPVPDGPASDALSGGDTAAPRVIYLVYADGKALPTTPVDACNGMTAPKFVCNFAPTLEECQRQIQAYLDKWYADLNVVFTLTRPTSGSYYTEVVSSGGGAWCNVDARVAGVAPFLCKDIYGGVAYTFMGGDNAKQTATIIAQEQAHLVGLEHTNSDNDLMLPTICHNCDGFEDADNTVNGDRCARPTQNSYQLIKERLGAWTGGAKPQVFGCKSDSQGPTVSISEPGDGAMVGHDFSLRVEASDECALTNVSVNVSPQALSASMTSGPFQWDLTNITGQQTITVTALDGAGHSASTSITVTAGATQSAATPGDDPTKAHGCSTSGGAPGSAAGLLLALALVWRRRRHR